MKINGIQITTIAMAANLACITWSSYVLITTTNTPATRLILSLSVIIQTVFLFFNIKGRSRSLRLEHRRHRLEDQYKCPICQEMSLQPINPNIYSLPQILNGTYKIDNDAECIKCKATKKTLYNYLVWRKERAEWD